jgi:aspartyl-tRNA(Asn)/glutamyl-tRNA(Gln) amidotransferase subunit B
VLTMDRATGEFFDAAVKAGGAPKRLCNFLTQLGLKMANDRGCSVAELGISPAQLADLAKITDAGTISATAAATIFGKLGETSGKSPMDIAKELNLVQSSNASELEGVVDEVLAANSQAVSDAKDPKKGKKATGFLMGEVIKRTKGQANPKVVSEILARKLQ